MKTNTVTRWLTGMTLALGIADVSPAAEVVGVKLDDSDFKGKQQGEPMKNLGFHNALLKIWLGEKPVDSSLKPALLGKG